ncbi:unnamed protein product [Arabis nemorensis]|uniref:Uncharacterized protein n=1 Tax=Arabis nemorensis TaxID=586526 RepID=A0A565BLF9_9BRAS|nr:unnamed protein product [Arabis nemorensis]
MTNKILDCFKNQFIEQGELGGAQFAINENASGIIRAERAKRSIVSMMMLEKEQEKRSKKNKVVPKDTVEPLESWPESGEEEDDDKEEEVREGALASSTNKPLPDVG